MVEASRAWDLLNAHEATLALAPDDLEAGASSLPLPCRAAWLPRAAWEGAPAPPHGVVVLRGRRGVVVAGPAAALSALGDDVAELGALLDRYDRPVTVTRFADGTAWDYRERPRVMGIVNVTPDSFSDGGRFLDPGRAVAHGLALLDEGADVLDLGAESTRPGAPPVDEAEELRRLLPVVDGLRRAAPACRISVDTRHARVAAAAIDRGADLVNDVSALGDPDMARTCSVAGVPVVLMHMRGIPETMQRDTRYEDLVGEVLSVLRARVDAARDAGIAGDRILVDPGLGFGKSARGNAILLAQLRTLGSLGLPVLVGASRKAFLGALTGVKEPSARVAGSVAAAVHAVACGAAVVRVHDVAASRQAVAVAWHLRAPAAAERDERTEKGR